MEHVRLVGALVDRRAAQFIHSGRIELRPAQPLWIIGGKRLRLGPVGPDQFALTCPPLRPAVGGRTGENTAVALDHHVNYRPVRLYPGVTSPLVGKGPEDIDFVVFREDQSLRIHAGKRYINLKPADFDNYIGERAQRGRVLPRGFKNPGRIEIIE